jgi:hypothetical protein
VHLFLISSSSLARCRNNAPVFKTTLLAFQIVKASAISCRDNSFNSYGKLSASRAGFTRANAAGSSARRCSSTPLSHSSNSIPAAASKVLRRGEVEARINLGEAMVESPLARLQEAVGRRKRARALRGGRFSVDA